MKSLVLHLDLETRSWADLPKVGAHRYAEDPSTEIMLGSVGFERRDQTDPLKLDIQIANLRDNDKLLAGLHRHVKDGGIIRAHNAAFEHAMLAANGVVVPWSQMDCTMARASACGLPGALFLAAKACGTPDGKDLDGYRLMMKLCKPRPGGGWYEDPADIDRLARYCDQDVRVECALDEVLPQLSARERRVWELTQIINDRGVQLDQQMIQAAAQVAEYVMATADQEMNSLTGGVVQKVTQARKIVAWIKQQGVSCESIAEGHHEELILGAEVFDMPVVARVVALRAATAKAFKFKAMIEASCVDGRVRGSLGYHGTIQGRWIGRGVQFHNMKRIETEEDAADVALAVDLLRSSRPAKEIADSMAIMLESPLETLSICTRLAIIAKPGHRLIGGDYKNIEGRICAWLAGQRDKVQAFRDFDAGTGPDLYKVTAAKMLEIMPEEVTKAQRQETGKVSELSFQFQGAEGAYKKQGAKYGVRLPSEKIQANVRAWRAVNWAIVDMWKVLQEAAIEAVSAKGCVISVLDGKVQYACDKKFLYCRLPSTRYIHYPFPQVGWKTKVVEIDGDKIEFNRNTVSYESAKGYREDLYGGSQTAHVVSGLARDILVEGMFNLEAAGYPINLDIHDEAFSEVPIGFGSIEEYEYELLRPIAWMGDCPIAASTWEGPRYAH